MTVRTLERLAPTEYEIETRGLAMAADLLYANNERGAAKIITAEVLRRIVESRAPNLVSEIIEREVGVIQ